VSAALTDVAPVSLEAALASAGDVVAAAGGELWRLPEGEVHACAALEARAQGLMLRMVGEAESRGMPARDGAPSTPAWLRSHLRLTPRDARQLASVATATRGALSTTGAALAGGRVSLAQAAAVCEAVTSLPAHVDVDLRRRVEADLIDRAAHLDAVQLARLRRGILSALAPEIGEALEAAALEREEQRAAERRELWISDDGHGTPTTCAAGWTPRARRWSARRWTRWPLPARPTPNARTGAARPPAAPTRWSRWPAEPWPPAPCAAGTGNPRRSWSPSAYAR